MALGGGIFVTQNKVLPGTYINFISAARASATLADRGVAAMPLELDWGADDAVFMVTAEDFQKDSLKIFGYDYTNDKLKGLRDLFKNIHTGYFYKLMNTGVAASNTYCTAKYKGVRGNDLKTVVAVNVDDGTKVDVQTYLGTTLVDEQTVIPNTDNLADNDYVVWKTNVIINETAGLALTTGSNGDAVSGTQYQAALDAFEAVNFNTLGCLSTTAEIIDLVVQYTKRLRDTVGVKFQAVVYQTESADHEGVISVENAVTDSGEVASSLVYWVTGAQAGCAVNKSMTNKVYDGTFTVNTDFKQSELEAGIEAGMFMFHKVGDEVRVLDDINTFTTFTDEKSVDFASNQTVRVLDQIANDIATLFNGKYLGNVPNDADGRISLWNDIVKHHQELQSIRAIENFSADDVTVEAGETKKAVVVNDVVQPVNAMAQLYMTVVVE
jgi:hypothetical protein